jgi:hypothetical protein
MRNRTVRVKTSVPKKKARTTSATRPKAVRRRGTTGLAARSTLNAFGVEDGDDIGGSSRAELMMHFGSSVRLSCPTQN